MLTQDEDQQLVKRVQKGDKKAFDLLVLKYQHKILGLILCIVHDSHEAQDIAQEAFVKAYRALADFRGESAFYTWLYRIAINTAKNYLVSQGRRPPSSDLLINDAELHDYASLRNNESPEQIVFVTEMRQVIDDKLQSLSEELRTALMLREFEGMSYEDIANIMQCPVGTVRSRIFRAREVLDEALKPFLNNDVE
ncbi:UNVERIFIED_CONTAM: hypothetical protein GTU68_063750 [Idotea baltica]|nr:hypothetical protein [Idotea baltica]